MTIGEFFKVYKRMPSGWLSMEDSIILAKYEEMTKGRIVEVGSYKGRSTVLLGSTGREIYAIDTWQDWEGSKGDETFKEFRKNTVDLQLQFRRMDVKDWEPVPAQLVFLDGDHSYDGTVIQIKKAKECQPKYIAVHDYMKDTQPVIDACNDFLGPCHDKLGRVAVWGF